MSAAQVVVVHRPPGSSSRGAPVAQLEEEAADAASAGVGMRSGEELDLVVTVPPDVTEADDLVGVRDDERVEPWIGSRLMEPGGGVFRGEARDSLVGERAGVEERAELDGVGVRRRARLEVLGQMVLSRGSRPRGRAQ